MPAPASPGCSSGSMDNSSSPPAAQPTPHDGLDGAILIPGIIPKKNATSLPEHRAEALDTRSSVSLRGRVVANASLGSGLVVRIGGAAPRTFVVDPHVVPDLGTLKSCLVVDILAAAGDLTAPLI